MSTRQSLMPIISIEIPNVQIQKVNPDDMERKKTLNIVISMRVSA